jgi:Fe2+ or Zn2+ uptake regulation protein
MARPSLIPPAILALMREGQRHAWTLEQVSADLAARAVQANFSSVFRAVERLVGERQLRKVQLPTGAARYELSGAHHDHLHCSGCDALTPVPCLAANLDLAALEQSTGYAMTDHDIVLEGVCPRCRQHAVS